MAGSPDAPHPTRRRVLAGGAALAAWSAVPSAAARGRTRDARLLVVILRGGVDGLALLPPVGDPDYANVRDAFRHSLEGPTPAVPLDGLFALNPRLPTMARLWRRGEAAFVHAVHTPYRARSHFEAQDVLENGTPSDQHDADGWLGRALAARPSEALGRPRGAFAAGASTPLVLRGARDVLNWLPPGFPVATPDTRQRLLMMYEHTDPVLAATLAEGIAMERLMGSETEMGEAFDELMSGMGMEAGGNRQVLAAAAAAARTLAADDGPRVAVLDLTGFDTHRHQRVVNGRLGNLFSRLDDMIAALAAGLGPVWGDTVLALVTEFGRTVEMNGAEGTDHGQASAAILLGGAVAGGRVVADWPGLSPAALYEGRDLRPTTDLRAVLKGLLRDHLGYERAELDRTVFPDSAAVRPLEGLIRSA